MRVIGEGPDMMKDCGLDGAPAKSIADSLRKGTAGVLAPRSIYPGSRVRRNGSGPLGTVISVGDELAHVTFEGSTGEESVLVSELSLVNGPYMQPTSHRDAEAAFIIGAMASMNRAEVPSILRKNMTDAGLGDLLPRAPMAKTQGDEVLRINPKTKQFEHINKRASGDDEFKHMQGVILNANVPESRKVKALDYLKRAAEINALAASL